MCKLIKVEACMWRTILQPFGADIPECSRCSFCAPGGDAFVRRAAVEDWNFKVETPRRIVVYGLSRHGDKAVANMMKRFKSLIREQIPAVASVPPLWCLSWIPRGTRQPDPNESVARELAGALGLSAVPFLTPNPAAQSMTKANNDETRAVAVETKFLAWKVEELPTKKVLLFDDAIKSGFTFDKAAGPLLDAGFDVIGLVETVWAAAAEPIKASQTG